MEKVDEIKIYRMSDEEVSSHPMIVLKDEESITGFYSWLIDELKVPEDFKVDCRGINVAENIQEFWINNAKEKGIDTTTIMEILLMNGPKVDASLSKNEICIKGNFLVKSSET